MSHSPSVSRSIHKVSYRDLYKSPTSSSGGTRNMIYQSDDCNGSPVDGGCLNWRSAYKKRCFDEFKKSRQKLLCKFRNLEVILRETFYFYRSSRHTKFCLQVVLILSFSIFKLIYCALKNKFK
jgi:hypothetical protein